MTDSLILIGASVRAAAFSALRAGFQPWCADLFGDLDLVGRCPCTVIPARDYPDGFLDIIAQAPPGPIVYTGALENAHTLLKRLSSRRIVWGNVGAALMKTRTPAKLVQILRGQGLSVPDIHPANSSPPEGNWLIKPKAGAAGTGIRIWNGQPLPTTRARRFYLQRHIAGPSGAALFVGTATQGVRLLGITRQLVGETWLNAAPFHYCGSVGPWRLPERATETLERIGATLTQEGGVRGLFGVDFVLSDDIPWPVEVNPRYTASVEVLEYATGLSALALHAAAFGARLPQADLQTASAGAVVAKAIYYAPQTLAVPEDAPWMETLALTELPPFGDLPAAGQVIPAGRPVLTCFAAGPSEADCLDKLRLSVVELTQRAVG